MFARERRLAESVARRATGARSSSGGFGKAKVSATQTRDEPVNKNELIEIVVSATNLKKTEAAMAVETVFGAITKSLTGGKEVKIAGFGSFSVLKRAARTGRNPRTGESIKIEASKQPKFKAGKALKDAVNS